MADGRSGGVVGLAWSSGRGGTGSCGSGRGGDVGILLSGRDEFVNRGEVDSLGGLATESEEKTYRVRITAIVERGAQGQRTRYRQTLLRVGRRQGQPADLSGQKTGVP